MTQLVKGPRRLEIERRLALFHANRPKVIARELGCSMAWICEISKKMKRGNQRANSSARTTPQEGNSKPLVKGP
jgi:hypothetical protein